MSQRRNSSTPVLDMSFCRRMLELYLPHETKKSFCKRSFPRFKGQIEAAFLNGNYHSSFLGYLDDKKQQNLQRTETKFSRMKSHLHGRAKITIF
jgi:hypothetical protein